MGSERFLVGVGVDGLRRLKLTVVMRVKRIGVEGVITFDRGD